MIFTLIIFLLVVIFMAFFIGKNLTNACTIWFFKTYTELPVVGLVLIAFGAGIALSILLVTIAKFRKSMKTTETVVVEAKKEKSDKREKTEKKLKKLKNKKAKPETEPSSDVTVAADKPL